MFTIRQVLALLGTASLCCAIPSPSHAVPQLISFQGRVQVGGIDFTGSGSFKFALVNKAGDTTLWSNDGTSIAGFEPADAVSLSVVNGLYSILLGDATIPNMSVVPVAVFANDEVLLRIWFDDGTHGFQQLEPDQRIAAVGYAMMAANAQTARSVPDGAITSAKLAAGAVGTTQLADGAVSADKISNGTITSDKLATSVPKIQIGIVQDVPYVLGASGLQPFTVEFSPAFASLPAFLPYGNTPEFSSIQFSSIDVTEIGVSGFVTVFSRERFPYVTADPNAQGAYSSIAEVNGNPAISYQDRTRSQLKYVRARDAVGSSWGTPVTIASTGDVGEFSSLTVVNARPAICFYDRTNGALRFVRATDTDGENWKSPVLVDSDGDVGRHTSLAEVNGRPAIAYRDWTNLDLKYARSSDADGDNWDAPVTIDSDGTVAAYPSLVVVEGQPAVSYRDLTGGTLNYVRATDSDGSDWGTPVEVDDNGAGFSGTAMAIVNGNPAICYDKGERPHYIRAIDNMGAVWGEPVMLETTKSIQFSAGLAVVDGIPFARSGEYLFRSKDTVGTAWDDGVNILQYPGSSELNPSGLADIDGKPAFSVGGFAGGGELLFWRLPEQNVFKFNWIAVSP
ncbi:MAG: hypothetical protein KDN22_32230 [Verrucomicrobiae bacterium]|nr:hypothetical protein [Verrucomicrobiae bacterium]